MACTFLFILLALPTQPAAATTQSTQVQSITSPPAATQPAPRSAATRPGARTAEEMLSQMLKPASEGPRPLKSIPDAGGGLDASSTNAVAPGAAAQKLLPEGTFLLDRVARLTPGVQGRLPELTLDSDGRAMTDPPLVILPNKRLSEIERLVEGSSADLRFRVSGEVTQYKDRNYLLIQRWSQVSEVVHPLQ